MWGMVIEPPTIKATLITSKTRLSARERDFTVAIYDALLLSGAYNSRPSSSNWNPNADINGDNAVDIYDAIILAGNYGKTAQSIHLFSCRRRSTTHREKMRQK
jgi:hypothetical protein